MRKIKKNACLTLIGHEARGINDCAHDVDIYIDNELIAKIKRSYGSCHGNMEHDAFEWLKEQGIIPKDVGHTYAWMSENKIKFLCIEAQSRLYKHLNAETQDMRRS